MALGATRVHVIGNVIGYGAQLTGAGTYRVSFARDVSHCAIVATPVDDRLLRKVVAA